MKNYRTMYDDLFCPCHVCEALAQAEMQATPPTESIKLTGATQDSGTDSPDQINGPLSLVNESWSSTHASMSSRTLRLSMDGSINEHHFEHEQEQPVHEVQTCESVTISPRRNVRRIVSLEVSKPSRSEYELDSRFEIEQERKPKSLSRLETKSPRQPRYQRRCSVTKFSLEDALFQVQQEEQQTCKLAPCIEEGQEHEQRQEPTPRRQRAQRRCSVTKYSLDDVLQVVQQEEKAMANSLSPCPEEIPVKELEQSAGHGLVATLESKRNFKARLPWGRAA